MGNDSTVVTVIKKQPSSQRPSSRDACLVVINGVDLGKKYTLSKDATLIGRSSKADIQVDEDAISRNHASVEHRGADIVVRDLNSTNGTYVNDRPIHDHRLEDGEQIKIGRTIFKFLSNNIEAAYHDEIYRLTTVDGLTQTYNKRFFLHELEREMMRSLRYERHLSLIMIDIDHFKSINDTYGHLAGDYVLKHVAQRILRHTRRDCDIFARYGGEEFALLLPEVELAGAVQIAEKMRQITEREPFIFDNVPIKTTLSLGVAQLNEYLSAQELAMSATLQPNAFAFIKLADDRLYRAKNNGRNRVVG